jgi:hypothetical protein
MLRIVLSVAALFCALTLQAAQPQPTQCATRERLIPLTDDYLAALVAHDPRRLSPTGW